MTTTRRNGLRLLVATSVLTTLVGGCAMLRGGDSVPSAVAAGGHDSSSASGGATRAPSASTTVPSPSPGTSLVQGAGATVPVHPARTLRPVPWSVTRPLGDARLRVLRVTPVQGVAQAPGEISAPALQFTLLAHNPSRRPVALSTVVVAAAAGADLAPADKFSGQTRPFPSVVKPGASVRAVYTFAVAPDERGHVRLEVSVAGTTPVVAFEGSIR